MLSLFYDHKQAAGHWDLLLAIYAYWLAAYQEATATLASMLAPL
jgi:hypothetical protein